MSSESAACCACTTVKHTPLSFGNAVYTDRWVCTECGQEFTKVIPVEHIRRKGNMSCKHESPISIDPSCNGGYTLLCVGCRLRGRSSQEGVDWEPKVSSEDLPGGSTPSQYALPPEAKELQDLIEYRQMNFAMGNIFKACYRHKDVGDPLYDIRKIIWFAKREEARLMKGAACNE